MAKANKKNVHILKEIAFLPVFTYVSRYSAVRFSGGGTTLQFLDTVSELDCLLKIFAL